MKTLLIISAVFFYSYIVLIYFKFGVLKSISDSYYKFSEIGKKNIFTLFTFAYSAPLCIYSQGSGLLFFAGAFIALVGMESGFREELEGKLHVAFVMLGSFLGYAYLLFNVSWIPLAIMAVTCFPLWYFQVKHHTWWIEIIAYTIFILSL